MKSLRTLLLISLPMVLGTLISFPAAVFWKPVPVLVFKIDVGMSIFIFGVFITLILGAMVIGDWRRREESKRVIGDIRSEEEGSRRRFLHRLDHEIKNPLTGLQASLANLQDATNPEARRRAVENARRAVERLSHLLADLRKLSDLEERPLERLPVDVAGLLEEMVDAACSYPIHQRRHVNLMVSHIPWPLPSVTGDRDLLGLAFYNLIENALKFTSEEDSVEIRAREDSRVLIVEVADSGPGIPSEEVSKIFEELYRGANARGVEGSGLGLAFVQRIVRMHGGEILVQSRQDGVQGTIFTVRLPVTRL